MSDFLKNLESLGSLAQYSSNKEKSSEIINDIKNLHHKLESSDVDPDDIKEELYSSAIAILRRINNGTFVFGKYVSFPKSQSGEILQNLPYKKLDKQKISEILSRATSKNHHEIVSVILNLFHNVDEPTKVALAQIYESLTSSKGYDNIKNAVRYVEIQSESQDIKGGGRSYVDLISTIFGFLGSTGISYAVITIVFRLYDLADLYIWEKTGFDLAKNVGGKWGFFMMKLLSYFGVLILGFKYYMNVIAYVENFVRTLLNKIFLSSDDELYVAYNIGVNDLIKKLADLDERDFKKNSFALRYRYAWFDKEKKIEKLRVVESNRLWMSKIPDIEFGKSSDDIVESLINESRFGSIREKYIVSVLDLKQAIDNNNPNKDDLKGVYVEDKPNSDGYDLMDPILMSPLDDKDFLLKITSSSNAIFYLPLKTMIIGYRTNYTKNPLTQEVLPADLIEAFSKAKKEELPERDDSKGCVIL